VCPHGRLIACVQNKDLLSVKFSWRQHCTRQFVAHFEHDTITLHFLFRSGHQKQNEERIHSRVLTWPEVDERLLRRWGGPSENVREGGSRRSVPGSLLRSTCAMKEKWRSDLSNPDLHHAFWRVLSRDFAAFLVFFCVWAIRLPLFPVAEKTHIFLFLTMSAFFLCAEHFCSDLSQKGFAFSSNASFLDPFVERKLSSSLVVYRQLWNLLHAHVSSGDGCCWETASWKFIFWEHSTLILRSTQSRDKLYREPTVVKWASRRNSWFLTSRRSGTHLDVSGQVSRPQRGPFVDLSAKEKHKSCVTHACVRSCEACVMIEIVPVVSTNIPE